MVLFTLVWTLQMLLSFIQCLELRYHNSVEVEKYLTEISQNYSDFTHLYSIGKSVEGRDLWVLVLSKYPKEHRIGIPEFKYVGNMHGNEVVGRVMLLQLIDYLTQGYGSDSFVTRLLTSVRVHILPSMNPDGFEASERDCYNTVGRYNKNGQDLNRNFPDAFSGNEEQGQEVEVQAVMKWLKTEMFVLSANLHGGAVVASYPYDNSNGGSELQNDASVSPDNDVFVHLAKTYSISHARMFYGNVCNDVNFPLGFTNGFYWYALAGGMQDYNYLWGWCLEITLELSCCKFPPESELRGLWEDNRAALLAYIKQVHLGVKGQVLDANGTPALNAEVKVMGRNNLTPYRTNMNGEYYRLLLPGKYTFRVSLAGHEPLTETLSIPNGTEQFSALTHNFQLRALETPSSGSQSSASPELKQYRYSCTMLVAQLILLACLLCSF
ncbi:carboxypeptidase M isoform X1 [Denticeps clupeoides]|nr:carboxypeptidase M isoform X1 [Denticeps clupeoides]